MSVFNANNTEWKTGEYQLFLGEQPALHDSINRPYPELFEKYKLQKSIDWDENEINLDQSRMDLMTCSKNNYDIMLKNLAFQWELDSVASRAIAPLFAPFVTNSELWAWYMKCSEIECVTPDTEVLTENGWVRIDELEEGTPIAQYNTDNRNIDFTTPTRYVKKPHKGVMYKFWNEQGHFSQQVTPNHRMVLAYPYKYKGDTFKLAKDVNFHGSNAVVVAGEKIDGSWREFSALHAFYVAVQADGSVPNEKYTGARVGTVPYCFGLRKQRKIDRLYSICKELGFNVKEINVADDTRRFYVDVPLEFSHTDMKSFEWIDLKEVTKPWVDGFVEEISLWDGYRPEKDNENYKGFVKYCSTNFECIDKAQTAITLGGYGTHVSELMPVGNRKVAYQLSITSRWSRAGNTINKEEVEYDGEVYCVTVPTSTFLVRHNGSISVTGNCLHALTYSEIIRQCIPNPQEAISEAMDNNDILIRSTKVVEVFDNLEKIGAMYTLGLVDKEDTKVRNAILLGVIALYCLERIEFMSSFAATFSLGEQGVFQGICKLVQKIASDEQVHYMAGEDVINIMKRTGWLVDMHLIKDQIQDLVDSVVLQELTWNTYLFSEGRSIVGLNKGLLDEWVLYNAQDTYNILGLNNPHTVITENPLPWMENWLDLNKSQNANQEASNNNYTLNTVIDDVGDDELDFDF